MSVTTADTVTGIGDGVPTVTATEKPIKVSVIGRVGGIEGEKSKVPPTPIGGGPETLTPTPKYGPEKSAGVPKMNVYSPPPETP